MRQIAGMAMLAGIGFTVSLFIAALAFDATTLEAEAKLGILVASAFAAVAGSPVLRAAIPRAPSSSWPGPAGAACFTVPSVLRLVVVAAVAIALTWTALLLLASRLPRGVLRDLARFLPACITTVRRLRADPRVLDAGLPTVSLEPSENGT